MPCAEPGKLTGHTPSFEMSSRKREPCTETRDLTERKYQIQVRLAGMWRPLCPLNVLKVAFQPPVSTFTGAR